MKKLSHLLIFSLASIFLLASCTSSRDVAKAEPGPQYRYNKVYVGNKILYRGINDRQAESRQLVLTDLRKIEEEPLEKAVTLEKPEKIEAAEEKSSKTALLTSVSLLFVNNLARITNGVMQGKLVENQVKRNALVQKGEDKTQDTGISEIFAVLGFVFGLASLINAIWFSAILGIVFSILGWNSDWHIFAFLGLLFSLAGVVLFLVL